MSPNDNRTREAPWTGDDSTLAGGGRVVTSPAFRHRDCTTIDYADYHYWEARGRRLQARAVAAAATCLRDALWRGAKAAVAALRREHARRRTFDTLSSLSDHELRDLGLHRSELPWIARECSRGNPRPHVAASATTPEHREPADVPAARRAA